MGNAEDQRMRMQIAYKLPTFGARYYDSEISTDMIRAVQASWEDGCKGNTYEYKAFSKKNPKASVAHFFGGIFYGKLFQISMETRAMFKVPSTPTLPPFPRVPLGVA